MSPFGIWDFAPFGIALFSYHQVTFRNAAIAVLSVERIRVTRTGRSLSSVDGAARQGNWPMVYDREARGMLRPLRPDYADGWR